MFSTVQIHMCTYIRFEQATYAVNISLDKAVLFSQSQRSSGSMRDSTYGIKFCLVLIKVFQNHKQKKNEKSLIILDVFCCVLFVLTLGNNLQKGYQEYGNCITEDVV